MCNALTYLVDKPCDQKSIKQYFEYSNTTELTAFLVSSEAKDHKNDFFKGLKVLVSVFKK